MRGIEGQYGGDGLVAVGEVTTDVQGVDGRPGRGGIDDRGWSAERYRAWLLDTLAGALLPDAGDGPPRSAARRWRSRRARTAE